jgi:hypothetical protein
MPLNWIPERTSIGPPDAGTGVKGGSISVACAECKGAAIKLKSKVVITIAMDLRMLRHWLIFLILKSILS